MAFKNSAQVPRDKCVVTSWKKCQRSLNWGPLKFASPLKLTELCCLRVNRTYGVFSKFIVNRQFDTQGSVLLLKDDLHEAEVSVWGVEQSGSWWWALDYGILRTFHVSKLRKWLSSWSSCEVGNTLGTAFGYIEPMGGGRTSTVLPCRAWRSYHLCGFYFSYINCLR